MKRWAEAAGVLVGVVLVAGGLGAAVGAGGTMVVGLPLPVFTALVAVVANLVAWVPASLLRTERFYDLTGTLTFLAIVGVCLGVTGDGPGWRATAACVAVAAWAVRLGWFLVSRIRRDGKDGRFDALKTDPARFLVPWSLQALWCAVCTLPVVGLVAHGGGGDGVTLADVVGFSLWSVGFGVEVLADAQKRQHREAVGGFVSTGLWAWCQHPNYLGEILLWTGLFVVGGGVFEGAQWLSVASPLLVVLLLTRVSGIPLIDARAEGRFGEDPAWRAYRARTPLLVPRPPSGRD